MGAALSSCCHETQNHTSATKHIDNNKGKKIDISADFPQNSPQGEDTIPSSTRVRRLSVVTSDQAKKIIEQAAPSQQEDKNGEKALESTQAKGSNESASNTRNRRLSVVTSEEMKEKLGTGSTPDVTPKVDFEEPVDFVRNLSRNRSGKSENSLEAKVACISRTGREPGFKKTNQDNCLAFEKFIRHGNSLFAAFDGHGSNGHAVSAFVKHHLPLTITRQLSKAGRHPNDEEVMQTLRASFLEVHNEISQSPIDIEFSGTTATVGYLMGRKLYVAWVGDSRCVLGIAEKDEKVTAEDLTMDHKPENSIEKARIISAGGRVERLTDQQGEDVGPWRVWAKYAWIPGLAMSRAIGDNCAHQMGVISEPDIRIREITTEARFAIFASDGVWEFVSSQEAVEIVSDCADVRIGCRKLVDEAYHRWLIEEQGVVDDITAVVVQFNLPEELQRDSPDE